MKTSCLCIIYMFLMCLCIFSVTLVDKLLHQIWFIVMNVIRKFATFCLLKCSKFLIHYVFHTFCHFNVLSPFTLVNGKNAEAYVGATMFYCIFSQYYWYGIVWLVNMKLLKLTIVKSRLNLWGLQKQRKI